MLQQQELYHRLRQEAERAYPNKVGLYEEHHFVPIFLGGPANGKTYRIPAPYHQLITNEFRRIQPYGSPTPSQERLQEILLEVYTKYPIPQQVGIPNP